MNIIMKFLARLEVERAFDQILKEAGVTREDLKNGNFEFGPDGKLRKKAFSDETDEQL